MLLAVVCSLLTAIFPSTAVALVSHPMLARLKEQARAIAELERRDMRGGTCQTRRRTTLKFRWGVKPVMSRTSHQTDHYDPAHAHPSRLSRSRAFRPRMISHIMSRH